MTVEEKFYLLLLDEVRAQPRLADELRSTDRSVDLERLAERFAGRPLDAALAKLSERDPCQGGQRFVAVQALGAEPTKLTMTLEELRWGLSGDERTDYDGLCRGALLNLLWRDFQRAEEKVNLAKYLRDDWAFAHFVYGLQRGIDGEVGKAHFELYLAINRETFPSARQRIDRALALVR